MNSESLVNNARYSQGEYFPNKSLVYPNRMHEQYNAKPAGSYFTKQSQPFPELYGQVYQNPNSNLQINPSIDLRSYKDFSTRSPADFLDQRVRGANISTITLDRLKENFNFSSQEEDEDDEEDDDDYDDEEINEQPSKNKNLQNKNNNNNKANLKRNVKAILSHPDLSTLESKGKAQTTQKGNVKNAYIKKINSVMNFYKYEESVSDEKMTKKRARRKSKDDIKINDDNLKQEDQDKDSNTKKLERNRESARNSRQRKKFYMELLEDKVQQLQQEISEAQSKLEENNNEYNKVCENVNSLNGLLIGERRNVEDLEKVLFKPTAERGHYEYLFENFKNNYGPNGKIRKEALNQFFTQIQEHFLPISLKGLLLSADLDEKIMHSNNPQAIEQHKVATEELKVKFGMLPEQEENFKISMAKLACQKRRFDEHLRRMSKAKQSLENEIKDLDNYTEELSRILNPVQIAKFYIKVANSKSDIQQVLDKRWFQSMLFRKDNEIDSFGIKRERNYTDSFPAGNIDKNNNKGNFENNFNEYPVKKRLFNN